MRIQKPQLLHEGVDEKEIIDFSNFFFKFTPYKYQEEFLRACISNKRIIGIWARQSGKSLAVAVYCLYSCLIRPDTTIVIVAPSQSQSVELYRKIRGMMDMNVELKDNLIKDTETEMIFKNKSRIIALPCGQEGKTIRGYTADIEILEEAQDIKDSIVNRIITPMIASKPHGQIIKIGTPLLKNHFYQSCYSDKNYKVFKVVWQDCVEAGQHTLEFIEEQKENLLDMEFRSEYCAEFVSDLNCFFNSELINSCTENFELWKNV